MNFVSLREFDGGCYDDPLPYNMNIVRVTMTCTNSFKPHPSVQDFACSLQDTIQLAARLKTREERLKKPRDEDDDFTDRPTEIDDEKDCSQHAPPLCSK